MQNKPEIIIGTLESYTVGYFIETNEEGKLNFICSFKEKSHLKKLKELHVMGKFLISSGADECVKVFNLNNRKEVAIIHSENGILSSLDSYNGLLYCGAEDGTIQIMKKNQWEVIKTLKCKKKSKSSVDSLSLHPNGKLALSLTRNEVLSTWDLNTHKLVTSNKINKPDGCITTSGVNMVVWSPLGNHYAMVCSNIIDIFNQESGEIITSLDFAKPIYSVVFLSSDVIAVGGERKEICIFSIKENKSLVQWEAHDNRIKALKLLPIEKSNLIALISASSDGFVKVWKIMVKKITKKPRLIGEVDTGCRITCIAVRSITVDIKSNKQTEASISGEVNKPKRKKLKLK